MGMQHPDFEPRLFQIGNATGAMRVEEVFYFTQDDLTNDDVFLLDVVSRVYVWIGSQSNDEERKTAMDVAQKYIEQANDGRPPEVPRVVVKSGFEPKTFTCYFPHWNEVKRQDSKM